MENEVKAHGLTSSTYNEPQKDHLEKKTSVSSSFSIDEEKLILENDGLSYYDLNREPRPLVIDDSTTTVRIRNLNVELTCPVCLGILRNTMTVMECLHRFCEECISKSLRMGKKECPSCRVKCSSRRHLRPDLNFDGIIQQFYPNLDDYEAKEESVIEEITKNLMQSGTLIESITEGKKRQAQVKSMRMGKKGFKKLRNDSEETEKNEVPNEENSNRHQRRYKGKYLKGNEENSGSDNSNDASPDEKADDQSYHSKDKKREIELRKDASRTKSKSKRQHKHLHQEEQQPSKNNISKKMNRNNANTGINNFAAESTSSRSNALQSAANEEEEISFVVLRHPNETNLPQLQNRFLRTSKRLTVAHLCKYFAKRFDSTDWKLFKVSIDPKTPPLNDDVTLEKIMKEIWLKSEELTLYYCLNNSVA